MEKQISPTKFTCRYPVCVCPHHHYELRNDCCMNFSSLSLLDLEEVVFRPFVVIIIIIHTRPSIILYVHTVFPTPTPWITLVLVPPRRPTTEKHHRIDDTPPAWG
jgi:hypothetical protein